MDFLKKIFNWSLFIIVILLVNNYIFTIGRVNGNSMYPNLNNNQFILIDKFFFKNNNLNRFDIVAVKFKGEKQIFVKRLIGLPSENISYKNNKLFVNNIEIKEDFLPQQIQTNDINFNSLNNSEYIVLGDNRQNSKDSRKLGMLKKEEIIGKIYKF